MLRMLGLLWVVLSGSSLLLLEEPELSLHQDVVARHSQLFARAQQQSRRQIILSSHSEDLLRDEGIDADEVLIVEPGREGSQVRRLADRPDVMIQVEAGVPVPEVARSVTRPHGAEQLELFGR